MAGRVMFEGIRLWRNLAEQLKSFQIVCRPFCFDFDHGLQRLRGERVSGGMEGQGNAATVVVAIDVMRSASAVEGKTIANESRDHFLGGQTAKPPVIDRHVVRR